ncbi:MAG: nucleotidyl transferase [Kordiimonas sp.]|nr:nucleotidyl transferase [Kordiimonas sp.]|tara:strand:+ start:409 stop:1218 length:810 start_codon:yes stop_codon:yes gene_type:complete
MKFHAVIMAAQRPGVINELAVAAGVSHKCIIEIAGKPLIEHVVDCLEATPEIGNMTVSIDQPDALDNCKTLQRLKAEGRLRIVMARENLYLSVAAALEGEDTYPSIITTGDNTLHEPHMISYFCEQLAQTDADSAVAVVTKDTLLNKYPGGQKKFHRFADDSYSNCNLYAIMTPTALNIGRIFETGGQFAKQPKRVLKAVGLFNALAYRYAWFSFDKAMERLSKRFKVKLAAIRLPFPEAPIDVDNEKSRIQSEEILLQRQAAAAAAKG